MDNTFALLTFAELLSVGLLLLSGRRGWSKIVMWASVRISRFVASVVGVVWVRLAVIETGRHTEIRASKVPHVLILFSNCRVVEILITDETVLVYNHMSAFKWVR